MSLIIKIQANHEILTVISAERIKTGELPGELNKYKIAAMDYRSDNEGEHTMHGIIEYKGDAETLAMKAIERVITTKPIKAKV